MAAIEPTIINFFHLSIDGVEMFPITSVSGLGRRIASATHKALNQQGKPVQRVVPSQLTMPGQLQCAGFLYPKDAVSKWFFSILGGKTELKNGTLTLYNYDGETVERWSFEGLWPSNISYGSLDAGGDETPTGSVTFQFEQIVRG